MTKVANNTETTEQRNARLKAQGFQPGQSGNPSGRPKGTLKDYVRKMFMEMSDEEKKAWLKSGKVSAVDIWKMGEGNPKQDIEANVEVASKVIKLDE